MTDLEGVRVKPLVWEHHPAGTMAADNVGFSYIIDTRGGGRPLFRRWPSGFGPEIGTVDEGKRKAQADFERRILSALEPSPSCPHCGGECGGSNGWCADMSKAPRDGRTILIHRYGGVTGQFLARWWTFDDGFHGRWQTFSSNGSSDYPGDPSCWQPAPTPPAQEPET